MAIESEYSVPLLESQEQGANSGVVTLAAYRIVVDECDAEWAAQWQWFIKASWWGARARNLYAARFTTNAERDSGNFGESATALLHRELLGLAHGNGLVVDHINGDGLDNRRSNMRVCTYRENSLNRGPARNGTTGYKGVSFVKKARTKPYQAQITENGRTHYLGVYATADEAAIAYDFAAVDLFGEFAWLNFREGLDR